VSRLSRRDVLVGSGALVVAVAMDSPAVAASELFQPNAYIIVPVEGPITFVLPRQEMGQGVDTALAQIIAEGLDVDPRAVVIRYEGSGRAENTDGSSSVAQLYEPLIEAGEQARRALVAAAASRWGTEAATLLTDRGSVIDPASQRRVSYQELAAGAGAFVQPAAAPSAIRPRRGLIGAALPRLSAAEMARGARRFVGDETWPEMLVAVFARARTLGGRVLSYDASAARRVPGVVDVIALPAYSGSTASTNAGVAVVATSTWAALKGRGALDARFAEAASNGIADDDAMHAALKARLETPLSRFRANGDVQAGFAAAKMLVDLTFRTPLQAHAALEPPVCLVDPTKRPWRVRAPTQAPTRARAALARALGMAEDQIAVEAAPLGGAFGRKSQSDFIVEAGRLAQRLGRPVKVIWTRDDDLRHDFYRPPSAQRIRFGLDRAGRPLAWHHQTVFSSLVTAFAPDADPQAPGEWEVAQGASSLPYSMPAIFVEGGSIRVPVRVGWVRAVHYIHHIMATNVTIDAAARQVDADPIEFHRRLLPSAPEIRLDLGDPRWSVVYETQRLHAVCEQVRVMAAWDRPRPPRVGKGFALSLSHGTAAACVVELAVEGDRSVALRHIWLALDCGLAINPDGVRQQVEGGVIEALAATLWQEIHLEGGAVQAATFADYPLFSMKDICPIEAHVMPSPQAPSGVGETALPPVAPAVVNAVFDAMGERHTVLPLMIDGKLRPPRA
jgi:isoquinoline 1-oxidoreductase beta subunit